MLRIQDTETLVHIDDAKDNYGVPKTVVVNVPVETILVILLGSYKQSKYLTKTDKKKRIQVQCHGAQN